MKKLISILIISTLFISCAPTQQLGAGVKISIDPRTIGMQIDDGMMQKNLQARLALTEKKIFIIDPSRSFRWKNFFSW